MRPADAYQGVGDSLQADVMRFMAIIAFCLIAILALVRSVEPPPTNRAPAAPVPPVAAQPAPPADPLPSAAPARVSPEVPPAEPRPSTAARLPAPPRPLPEPAPEPPLPEPVARQTPAAAPDPADSAAPDATPAAPDTPEAERGLSLRFASERDFLRLVNQGEVRLFAFRQGEVLAVSSDFSFEPADAPARLHELLPETIPALMAEALQAAHQADAYRWGIAMPESMARQIRRYVEQGVSGELVIDRYGEVRHHEA